MSNVEDKCEILKKYVDTFNKTFSFWYGTKRYDYTYKYEDNSKIGCHIIFAMKINEKTVDLGG